MILNLEVVLHRGLDILSLPEDKQQNCVDLSEGTVRITFERFEVTWSQPLPTERAIKEVFAVWQTISDGGDSGQVMSSLGF
ncbi:hypothetical protein CEXT_623571 [Caerostris extrusa]|uniref:Uncharacterized protein n=1 Tax=Caerostris extrusa TaxID=172846 RepID=A0AAV4PLN3_CAEEX|nr:hypothetical protein CEXT_623571 [Caerostris extrusa]